MRNVVGRRGLMLGGAAVLAALTGPAWAQETEVAYLSASSANTWLAASKAEMDKVAAANGIKITEFDAQFDPGKQTAQAQDVLASGKYKGVIFVALTGAGAIPDVQAMLDAGLQVVSLNQVIGEDLTTSDPQVAGMAASVMAAPYRSGTRMGALTVKACEGIDPCAVAYIYGIKGIPLDVALKQGSTTRSRITPISRSWPKARASTWARMAASPRRRTSWPPARRSMSSSARTSRCRARPSRWPTRAWRRARSS